ncbi:MAG: neutral zinc metallopeptidase [Dehalococcoidia bacterium]
MKIPGTSDRGAIDDRRGRRAGGIPGGVAIPIGGAGGCGGLIILLLILFLGGGQIIGGGLAPADESVDGGFGGVRPGRAPASGRAPDPDAPTVELVRFVVNDLNAYWADSFRASGRQYTPARLVLFEDVTQSGCGGAEAAVGPHYCPSDGQVYLDLSFFRELERRFGAPGDFAQAYVIAHEYGHHVQNVTGVLGQVARLQQQNPSRANDLQVRVELQADCLAGAWANSVYRQGLLESGDLEEGLNAAAAVGDDRLQRQATGRINPETWTHGSAEQRSRWFRAGFQSGSPETCNTFRGSP